MFDRVEKFLPSSSSRAKLSKHNTSPAGHEPHLSQINATTGVERSLGGNDGPAQVTNAEGVHLLPARPHDFSTGSAQYGLTTHQTQGFETPPPLEELIVEYRRFRSGDPAFRHSCVVQYVEALRGEKRELGERCRALEQSLEGLKQQADGVLKSIDPGVSKIASAHQPNIGDILRFVFDKYEYESQGSKDLQQQMEKNDASHQSELKELREKMDEKLNQEEFRRASDFSRQQKKHEDKIGDLGKEQKDKIETLTKEHKEEIGSLTAAYKQDLFTEKHRLEEEKARLQDALLSAADKFRPISDRDFVIQFNILKSSVTTLARSPLEVDAERLGEAFGQSDFVRTLSKIHYKFVLESAIWAILVHGIFSTPFKAFGHYGERFAAAWIHCISISKHGWISTNHTEEILNQTDIAWPQPETLSEKWRSLAVEELRSTLTTRGCMQPFAGDAKKGYEDNVAMVSEDLAKSLSRVCSEDKTMEIRDIVDKACFLALDMGMQRSRLQLFAPRLGDKVSRHYPKTYTEVNPNNEPKATSGTVRLVVRPGLRKTGDGRGGCLDQTTDLCPAGLYLV